MTSFDLVISGADVVTPGGVVARDVGITGERIAAIAPGLSGTRRIDASGCLLLPGAIDMHVHLSAQLDAREQFADDFASGTRAALAGGVTTVGQMSFPDDDAGPSFAAALDRDARAVHRDAVADVLLHPSVVFPAAETLLEIATLRERGCTSIKLVLNALDWRAGTPVIASLVAAAGQGALPMLHCEDEALIDYATSTLLEAGRGGIENYPESRPVGSEVAAVERAIAIAEATGTAVYLVHLSSAGAVDAVRRAKARGVAVFAETRPLYLYLTADVHARPDGAKYVGMPPVRSARDIDALWTALADGTLDTIATDHAPWTLAQKLDPERTILTSLKGVAELDTFLPMLYTEGVLTGRLSLQRLVEVVASSPARLFGLGATKGSIEVGKHADLVVLDPVAERVIDGAALHSRAGYSVYDGRSARGWPTFVVSRGDVVVSHGEVTAQAGRGRLLNEELTHV